MTHLRRRGAFDGARGNPYFQPMFEITRDDIAVLGDEDLRTLIGLLCEAELRRANLPVSAVTWGGDQDAKDGGLDVRVSLPADTKISGFVPRAATGFQVKKPDMPASEISKEMKPKGVLRPAIEELAAASGSYLIVSSSGSTSDSALNNRREAMAESVKDSANAAKLLLDFYDRNRVASWVRDHAGLIPWVRSKIGKSVPGWRSYGGWSHMPAGTDKAYLLDDKARIKTGSKDDGDGLSAVDGINRMRDALRNPGQVVRLVGLSGVGKTRLVEALFDPAIGANALDPSLAIYTDIADGPDPQPKGLASDLVASGTRAILVVDNCPPEIHKQVSEIARASGATICVITVEYDIREDQPEGTDVFSLDTSSLPVIEKLVRGRFPDVSQLDARTIAEFSGGNARIALALASTVQKSETISSLNSAELFTRLFQQRHEHDAGLLQIAEACSLVYSFQGELLTGEQAELPVLAGLIGRSAQEIFTAAAELRRRDLLQQRGPWRAILPHAIANGLAARALQNIPYGVIEPALVFGSERLLRSFSRRLGYLSNSKETQAIVRGWLGPGGMLADILSLTELGRVIFQNVAAVLPEATLGALEAVFANADKETLLGGVHYIRLLHALAYEPALFERAVKLLCKFAGVLDEGNREGEAVRAVTSLFYIVGSGTHASLPMRLAVLDALLKSANPVEQRLGSKSMEAALKTDHFTPFSPFEFGVRSRDYGYHPNGSEIGQWYEDVLKFAEPFALGESAVTAPIRTAIARKFRGLWTHVSRYDALERIAKAVAGTEVWRDGWVAARQTRQYDGSALKDEGLKRLTALEAHLRPKDLVNSVRGMVLGERGGSLDLEDFDDEDEEEVTTAERMRRTTETVEELGKSVASDEVALTTLVPELVNGSGRLGDFGRGLGIGAPEPRMIWDRLVAEVKASQSPNVQVLLGFLAGLETHDIAETNALLDESVDHSTMGAWLPELQASVKIDAAGVRRLRQALALGKASVGHFMVLVYGGVSEPIPGPDFRDLMLAIGAKPDGNRIALEILSMRLHLDATAKREPLPETVEAGRALLDQYTFARRGNQAEHDDYRLGVVSSKCLGGPEGAPIVSKLWRGLRTAIDTYDAYGWEQDDLLKGLFKRQPMAMLDELAAGTDKDRRKSIEIVQETMQHGRHPLSVLNDDVLLGWCDKDPKLRYPFAAGIALLFSRPNEQTLHNWQPIAELLLQRAPDPVPVFQAIQSRLRPRSWSGSLASKFESRLQLLDQLRIGNNSSLQQVFKAFRSELVETIAEQRKRELEEGRAESARFE
jgi:hypothetical protein